MGLRVRLAVAPAVILSCAFCADVRLSGKVTNDNSTPVPGARVEFQRADGWKAAVSSGAGGEFQYSFAEPGEYRVTVEREGYFRLVDRPIRLEEGENQAQLVLNPLREVFESVDVVASPSKVDFDRPAAHQSLSGAEMLSIPFPSSNNLKNALRIMPGMVQDVKGGVHLNGAAEEQVLYTLNGFSLNDPLTGRFDSRIGVEAVQSVDVAGGAVSAEFGKGTAGAIAITSRAGDDKFRYSATNFFPGFESNKSWYLGNWSPRLGLSGPIKAGRAWFSDSIALQYDKQVIEELPNGADSMTSWRASNLLHAQVNLTPSNIVFASFLTNLWNAPRTGLSVMNSPESTIDKRSRQWFLTLKDQIYFSRGMLLETGFASNRTFGREIPQGRAFLRITPEGNFGNSYFDAHRRGGRDQLLANLFLPALQKMGSHQFKTGVDIDRLFYWQDVIRTGYQQLRADGTCTRQVTFGGPSRFRRASVEASAYVLDSWRLRPNLLLELGVRMDRDSILRSWNVSPRAGVTWAPSRQRDWKLSASYSVVYDAANLRLFTRPYDQYSMTTYFGADGTPLPGPAIGVFTFGDPRVPTPRSRIWGGGVERTIFQNTYLRVNYVSRRLDRGFTYGNVLLAGLKPPPEMFERFGARIFDAIYRMDNQRRDTFDSIEITVRQSLRRQYGWLASYTRSSALSNGVVDLNIDDPIVVTQNAGPMPWDTPHRFVSWGYLPTPWKDWAMAFLLDTRSGFPFSTRNDHGQVIGAMNSWRLPAFFALNFHVERRIVLRGHRWELRGGFNNLTNHKNPTLVNSNIDSPRFMHFYGSQSRTFNFRIRWLGRVAR